MLFADLADFTTFADGRPATEVIEMLNAYWGAVVPSVVEREGGLIERFAGDAILAVFNALGDQPDHAARAVRAAVAIRDRSADVRASDDWPRFRVGVNTGVAVVGNVGAGSQRSFAVIGDTTNIAARLQGMSDAWPHHARRPDGGGGEGGARHRHRRARPRPRRPQGAGCSRRRPSSCSPWAPLPTTDPGQRWAGGTSMPSHTARQTRTVGSPSASAWTGFDRRAR